MTHVGPETIALSLLSFRCGVDAHAILFSLQPLTCVLTAISPFKNSNALLVVMDVVSCVATAVRPHEEALAMHLVLQPRTLVPSTVSPGVDALTTDVIVLKLAFKDRTVSPDKLAKAMLTALPVQTNVFGSVWPVLCTFTFLLVCYPAASVNGSITMLVDANAMCLVILPLPIVDITAGMKELATAMSLSVDELALVPSPIRPGLHPLSLRAPPSHVPEYVAPGAATKSTTSVLEG
eukprot:CAMPEP_0197675462 /NCGR_PEP_ID=MMETSP1338-20131121/84986_1 /TAXON_ID=43686 ORGANISM="Pelagodinium beii, Strain RCC1491" /NCGR_SAMPLE_ID=MMETSP1338 /ASSEMBLY_ACC=CAM_ASM_000754 /LENGTH=235 /DNA_ID=CAMNT_0043256003 /DNA_START=22 /DNA_END=731 /DNA_ORIENTATION=+